MESAKKENGTGGSRAEAISAAFPFAVETARAYRAEFGEGVKIMYASNAAGEEIRVKGYERWPGERGFSL